MNQKPNQLDVPSSEPRTATQWLQLLLPIAVSVVIAVNLLMLIPQSTQSQTGMSSFDFDTLGKVPVSEDGRVKPLDTVARNSLLVVSGRQSLRDEMLLPGEGDAEKPALIWLVELMSGRPESRERKVLRIDDPEILGMMGKTTEDGKFFSLNDLNQPAGEGKPEVYLEIDRLAREAQEVRDDQRTPFQEHVIGLRRHIAVMRDLQVMASPFVIPPVEAGQDWEPMVDVQRGGFTDAAVEREAAKDWRDLMQAFRENQPKAFNAGVDAYLERVSGYVPYDAQKASFERGYNRYEPFKWGVAFYIFAGLLGLLSLLLRPILPADWYTSLWRSALGVLMVTFLLHTAALLVRIWLQGRPPVTNLYSSAVFIGWALVGGSILLEKITKLGVASLAASCGGVATLIIAHNLAKDGDTMGVMQAVLDSNFWLGTHVITITIGYSATFLAGFIAILYIFFGMATPLIDRKSSRVIAGMVYAVICFALFFSFVGTVLGGIWADQSWGRFWGWDPKENGAILIVLINAIILHARWGHMIKERGLMVLAVGGNIVTAWSWFGTNMLGVGLHAYGFMDKAYIVLAAFVGSQLLIMAVALLVPTNYWVSFRRPTRPNKPKQANTPKPGRPGKAAPAGA